MNKEVYEAAYNRSGGVCEICGSGRMVELHHIIFGQGKRKQCERAETVIMLCYEHHRHPKAGVHFNRKLNMDLKRLASERLQESGLEGDELKQALGGRFYW